MTVVGSTRARWWSKITRDVVLTATGLGLTIREGLSTSAERPALYVLYATMMGFGPVLRYAERKQRQSDESPS